MRAFTRQEEQGSFGQGEAGEWGHIPLLEMLRLQQTNFIQAR